MPPTFKTSPFVLNIVLKLFGVVRGVPFRLDNLLNAIPDLGDKKIYDLRGC